MERERNIKIIVVVALIISVISLSLGFAAFSNSLTIVANSNVQPLNSLKVLFSSSNILQEEIGENIDVELLPSGETTLYPGFTVAVPIINNSIVTAPTLSNLKATFIRPGESVTYTLYIHNASSYDVELAAINFGTKNCVAKTGTSQNLVDAACGEIDIEVAVGGGTDEPPLVSASQKTNASNVVSGHVLGAGEYETVAVKLLYSDLSSGAGNTDIDGDFDVTFGDVTLTYTTAGE